jgi:hypothetical protein
MNIVQAISNVLGELMIVLSKTTDEEYREKLNVFSGSNIGMHTRHIIEFFDCLLGQKESGVISYNRSKRDQLIEHQISKAKESLSKILTALKKIDEDKSLNLQVNFSTVNNTYNEVVTSLYRELAYNLEHAIHHNALIRMGLHIVKPDLILPESFGVVPSTVKYLSSLN